MENKLLTSSSKAPIPWLLMPPDIDVGGLEDLPGANFAKTPDILSRKDMVETKLEREISQFVGRGYDSWSQMQTAAASKHSHLDNEMMQSQSSLKAVSILKFFVPNTGTHVAQPHMSIK